MTQEELQKYRHVQSIAKETIEFLKSFIKQGVSAKEIKDAAENFMHEKGVNSFWYHNVGAFVLVGEETTISVSGREYKPTDLKVQSNDLVTVDLAPNIDGFWGDFARSFVIENGKVVELENSSLLEFVEGIKKEQEIHRYFESLVNEEMSFEDIYIKLNSFIDNLGFENLDFKKNLGHSIAKNRDGQAWFTSGDKTKLKDVNLFAFEPHIKKKGGNYGFKMENIYYFENKNIIVL